MVYQIGGLSVGANNDSAGSFQLLAGLGQVLGVVSILRPDLVLERFVSQSPKELLIAPDWGLKNYEFNHRVQKRMKELGAYQGKKYEM